MVTSGGREFDPQSNKTVVAITKDAVLSIAYTGIAYIGELTTDEWLARAIMGDKDRKPRYNTMQFGYKFLPRTLRSLISRVVVSVKSEVFINRALRDNYLEIGISGHCIRNSYVSPYQMIIQKQRRSSSIYFHKAHRMKRPDYRQFSIWTSGGWPSVRPEIDRDMMSALRAVDNYEDANAQYKVREILYGVLSRYAENEPTISTDCMIVTHDATNKASQVEFRSMRKHFEKNLGHTFGDPSEILFLPWILGGQLVFPASEMTSSGVLSVGGYKVHLQGGEIAPGQSQIFYLGAQLRPRKA